MQTFTYVSVEGTAIHITVPWSTDTKFEPPMEIKFWSSINRPIIFYYYGEAK